jgi:CheY-like chemotaxis protein
MNSRDGDVFRMRDNGTGIAPEIKEKLFQPFVTTKPTGEGTGLGLSIAYDIVTQQHRETIEVDSVPGEFHRIHDPAAAQPSGRGEECMSVSVLVVDDETDVAAQFRQCFRREARARGTMCPAFRYSGEEALDKLAAGIEPRLNVILSDINMPVTDGLELLREIKTRQPDLPVMMVTAYGDAERRRLADE